MGLRELKATPRGRVDFHHRPACTRWRQTRRARQTRHPVDLGQSEIIKQRACRSDFGSPRIAKGLERTNPISLAQARFGIERIEPARRERRQNLFEGLRQSRHILTSQEGIGQQ